MQKKINKGNEFLSQTQICKTPASLQLDSVKCDISNSNYLIYQNSYMFEISKVYEIGLQRYNNRKILLCGKDLIPFFLNFF
jgi:hypothetical protein